MQISGLIVNQTPIFRIFSKEDSPWSQVWGAVAFPDGWAFPAYWPFGEWSVADLSRIRNQGLHTLEWDDQALELLKDLGRASKGWTAAEVAYRNKQKVPLPVDDDFFPPDYQPFAHQRLGIARAYYAYRAFFLYEMGTGKTKIAVDTLRILRREGRFTRAIVIAPPVVVSTWAREIERCSRGELTYSIWGERKFNPKADFILMTYGKVRSAYDRSYDAIAAVALGLEKLNFERASKKKKLLTPDDFEKLKRQCKNYLLEIDYDVLILDESHYIGDRTSRQSKIVMQLAASGKSARRLLLSGTAADKPQKLYTQLRCLSPALMTLTGEQFDRRYLVKPDDPKRKFLVLGYQHLNELNQKVSQVAVRMRKKDCLDLPALTVTDIPLRLSSDQIDQYNDLVAEILPEIEVLVKQGYKLSNLKKDEDGMYILPEDLKSQFSIPHVAALLNKLLQLISGFLIHTPSVTICDNCDFRNACVAADIKPYTRNCKVQPVRPPIEVIRCKTNPKRELFKELLERLLGSDETTKVICWGIYTPEIDDMVEVAEELKEYFKYDFPLSHIRMDGSTSKHVRKFEDQFREDPHCRLWISQIAAGIGINLVAANCSIYYSIPWSLPQYSQSMERYNRPGQTRSMTAYRILTHRALDQNVWIALKHKMKISRTLTDEVECSRCEDRPRCEREGNLPFEFGCKYQAYADRPIARAVAIPKTQRQYEEEQLVPLMKRRGEDEDLLELHRK